MSHNKSLWLVGSLVGFATGRCAQSLVIYAFPDYLAQPVLNLLVFVLTPSVP